MTTIELENGIRMKGENLKEIQLKDWQAEERRLFGDDPKQWKFECPHCHHVQSVADFIELREKGISDVNPETAFFSCIGRFDTRIKDVGTLSDNKRPCNYTNGGLFCLTDVFVIDPEGKRHAVFPFASH